MLIRFEGREWSLDFDDLSMKQAEVIEASTGQPLEKWLEALAEGTSSLKFIKTAYWLMRVQGGDKVRIQDVDFSVVKFAAAFSEAIAEGEQPEAEVVELPDPTRPAEGSAPSRAPSSRRKSPGTAAGSPHG